MASCMMTVLAFLVICLPLVGTVWVYIGCYKDDSDRLLQDYAVRNDRMTHSWCMNFCQKKNSEYAGLEASDNCYCGDKLNTNKYPKLHQNDCNIACLGDRNQMCGGYWRISIFKMTEYLGCYKDDSDRLLKNGGVRYLAMTHEFCIRFCKNANHKYAGLEANHECFCGNQLNTDKYPKMPEADCYAQCWGDYNQMCGGSWRISVFKLK